jgi:hypothetical protein
MGFRSNGVARPAASGGLNQYALVTYVPDPLGRFLDDLRRELVPGCKPHAHVSVLPPRPLVCDPAAALNEARALASEFEPFDIQAGDIQIFPLTDVVYIDIRNGGQPLREMHAALTDGYLQFNEPFEYHPHITLAQDLNRDQVQQVYGRATDAWRQYPGSRVFRADRVVFVQNTETGWIDLEEIELRAVPVR